MVCRASGCRAGAAGACHAGCFGKESLVFAGSSSRADVNTMSLQYFVNYNLQRGWFLTSGPTLSANWNAGSGNVWVVPFGGGFGRIFVLGHQAMNGSVSAYYNAVRPDTLPSATWQRRVQLALLFPRMPKAKK